MSSGEEPENSLKYSGAAEQKEAAGGSTPQAENPGRRDSFCVSGQFYRMGRTV